MFWSAICLETCLLILLLLVHDCFCPLFLEMFHIPLVYNLYLITTVSSVLGIYCVSVSWFCCHFDGFRSLIGCRCLILIGGTPVGINSGCFPSRESWPWFLPGARVCHLGSLGLELDPWLLPMPRSRLWAQHPNGNAAEGDDPQLKPGSWPFYCLSFPTKSALLLEELSRIVNSEINVSNVSYPKYIFWGGAVERGRFSVYPVGHTVKGGSISTFM